MIAIFPVSLNSIMFWYNYIFKCPTFFSTVLAFFKLIFFYVEVFIDSNPLFLPPPILRAAPQTWRNAAPPVSRLLPLLHLFHRLFLLLCLLPRVLLLLILLVHLLFHREEEETPSSPHFPLSITSQRWPTAGGTTAGGQRRTRWDLKKIVSWQ